jgi:hypothetical protein
MTRLQLILRLYLQTGRAALTTGPVQPGPVCGRGGGGGALRGGQPGAAGPAGPHPPGHARDLPPRVAPLLQAASSTFLPLPRRAHGLARLQAVQIQLETKRQLCVFESKVQICQKAFPFPLKKYCPMFFFYLLTIAGYFFRPAFCPFC